MGLLRRRFFASFALGVLPLLAALVIGCASSADLGLVASSVVEIQRLSNMTRTTMTGTWTGYLYSSESAKQRIYLIITQGEDITLSSSSLMVLEDMQVGGTVSQDSFFIYNGVFSVSDYRLRFNIADVNSGGLALDPSGKPLLFNGLLSENTFVSGEYTAGDQVLGAWEAGTAAQTP